MLPGANTDRINLAFKNNCLLSKFLRIKPDLIFENEKISVCKVFFNFCISLAIVFLSRAFKYINWYSLCKTGTLKKTCLDLQKIIINAVKFLWESFQKLALWLLNLPKPVYPFTQTKLFLCTLVAFDCDFRNLEFAIDLMYLILTKLNSSVSWIEDIVIITKSFRDCNSEIKSLFCPESFAAIKILLSCSR